MPTIQFSCHACGQVLQVGDDKIGRKAKCVQCGTVLVIPAQDGVAGNAASELAAGAPPPGPRRRDTDEVEAYDDRGEGRRRRSESDYDIGRRRPATQWDKISLGLLLAFIGLCVMAGGLVLDILGMLLNMGGIYAAILLYRFGAVIAFIGSIGAVVGHVFWLFLSNRNNALGFAIAALAVAGVFILLQIVWLINLFNPFVGAFNVVLLIMQLLQAAHFMMMAFYLRALAQRLGNGPIEKNSMLIVILSGAFAGYALLSGILAMSLPGMMAVGRGYIIFVILLRLLGAAALAALYVFTLLTMFRARSLVQRA